MPVEERLMKPGAFEIALKEDTPHSIRAIFGESTGPFNTDENFGFLGHVFITPTRLAPELQTRAQLLAASRYTGIMRRRRRRGITGSGLLAYLGNDQNIGDVVTQRMHFNQNFAGWMADIAHDEPSTYLGGRFDAGTITNTGAGTLDFDPYLLTRRQALDYVAAYFGGEYRVNPDNTFDAGSQADLFVTTPRAVVLPKGGPIDISLEGLRALSLDMEVDYEELCTGAVLIQSEGTLTDESLVSANPYRPKDLRDGSPSFHKVVESGSTTDPAAATAAQNQIVNGRPRRAIQLQAGRYDVAGKVAAGDTVYVYDPENFIFDLGNQVTYGGRVIYPMALRVVGIRWPIQEGMGVYYRRPSNALPAYPERITDLSDYIEWESGDGDLEVGEERRVLTPGRDTSAVVSRGTNSPRARVYRSTPQTIATGTLTLVNFDSSRYDDDDMHVPATSQKRFVIPVGGRYHVGACIQWEPNGTGVRMVRLWVNANRYIAGQTENSPSATVHCRLNAATDDKFAVGDVIEVEVYQDSGGDLDIDTVNDLGADFWIHKIGA